VVTIHDGGVYLSCEPRLLGPLTDAKANFTELRPVRRRTAPAMLLGFPEKQEVPQIRVTVAGGTGHHAKDVEGGVGISAAKTEIARFNLAVEAASEASE
jgi:hypothetical protein